MSVETPFPVEGEVEPTEYGYSAETPCTSEWMTETENGDMIQAAADRIARVHGEGTRMRVRFTSNWEGVCNDFELLEVVEEAEA